jgi:hypothetical protein
MLEIIKCYVSDIRGVAGVRARYLVQSSVGVWSLRSVICIFFFNMLLDLYLRPVRLTAEVCHFAVLN